MDGYDDRLIRRGRRPDPRYRFAPQWGGSRQVIDGQDRDDRDPADSATRNDAAGEAAADGSLENDLATVAAERDRYLDQLQRTAAEFANYRRRTENERVQQRLAANEALLREILPVLDDLQRGLAVVSPEEQETKLAEGIRAVEQKFMTALRKHGVTPIDALGAPFDPAVHEAVEMDPSGGSTVVAVYAPGYRLGDGTLRPAMVKVGTESESRSVG